MTARPTEPNIVDSGISLPILEHLLLSEADVEFIAASLTSESEHVIGFEQYRPGVAI